MNDASASFFLTGLSFPSVDGKLVGKITQGTVHGGEIVEGGTARLQRFVEHVFDVADQRFQTFGGRPV